MIRHFWCILSTLVNLGLLNIARVALYRLKLRSGYLCWKTPQTSHIIQGRFFKDSKRNIVLSEKKSKYILFVAKELLAGKQSAFGTQYIDVGVPPQWFKFNNSSIDTHWTKISINQDVGQDIKETWELSRFYWAPILASAYSLTGEEKYLSELNSWVDNWNHCNPSNYSVNWICAQEVAIRMINLLNTAYFLKQVNDPSNALIMLIETHCSRILPTLEYSMSQDNNHGSSEAAALFIGGAWLDSVASSDKRYHFYYKSGRTWLENRAKRLFDENGGAVQYSTNYHRVILDTYSMIEVWRCRLNLLEFSVGLYSSLKKSTNWLYQMVQPETGDVPNLGANDGSMLLPLMTDYRDYRPSVQLASVLFDQKRAYEEKGDWDSPLQWLNIKLPNTCRQPSDSSDFSSGGYSLLRKNKAFILFNIPRYKFRPSQCDALHLDLWLEGENFLRDGGTFSYNAGDAITQYFGGTASHNTIQFDDRDQMPRLSRFLLGAWLKAKEVLPVTKDQKGNLQTAAAYQDYQGAYHHRKVTLTNNKLLVKDTVKGFKQKAVLRWRLKPDNWCIDLKEKTITNGQHEIRIQSEVKIIRFEIVEGWESRYYLQKTPLPVLEIEIVQQGMITTEYHFTL